MERRDVVVEEDARGERSCVVEKVMHGDGEGWERRDVVESAPMPIGVRFLYV